MKMECKVGYYVLGMKKNLINVYIFKIVETFFLKNDFISIISEFESVRLLTYFITRIF
jgi:hypothetical protein